MLYSTLTSVLQSAGKPATAVDLPGGARALLLPHGGRVLGLFAPGDEENFYWTNPALGAAESARAFYGDSDWHNSGGDRTWLAPEADLFFPRFPEMDLTTYFQPRQLDPGCYQVETRGGAAVLVNQLTLPLYRSRTQVSAEIRKWIEPAANPLRYEKSPAAAGVCFAGYTQHTELTIIEGEGRLGLWNLVQMPHGGEMTIALYTRSEPRIYFGTIAAAELETTARAIRWRMRAQGEQKIGVRAVATCGRVGYRYESAATATLIVRNFFVNPSGEYIDSPWTEPEDLGYAVQACNVCSHWGSFSELEYHVPAAGSGTGTARSEDISQVWGFRGAPGAIDAIARLLLPL